jgi:hypothetical protein
VAVSRTGQSTPPRHDRWRERIVEQSGAGRAGNRAVEYGLLLVTLALLLVKALGEQILPQAGAWIVSILGR